MNEYNIKYISGILAGVAEVIITHPIDYYKTQKQYNAYNSNLINNFKIRNMYNGFVPRLLGIVPMRLVFWCTQDFGEDIFENYKYKYALAGGLAGFAQSLIDYPIEQFKIRNMIYKQPFNVILKDFINNKSHTNGFMLTSSRNILFAIIFNHIAKTHTNSNNTIYQNFMIASSSGFIAGALTQPIDYFKTIVQSSKEKQISIKDIFNDSLKTQKQNKFNMKYFVFFKGLWSRSSMTFLNMGIGFTIYQTSKKYLLE